MGKEKENRKKKKKNVMKSESESESESEIDSGSEAQSDIDSENEEEKSKNPNSMKQQIVKWVTEYMKGKDSETLSLKVIKESASAKFGADVIKAHENDVKETVISLI